MNVDFGLIIIMAGGLAGYELIKVAVVKLFNNKEKTNDCAELKALLPEKYVLYERYKEDYNKIEKRLREIWEKIDIIIEKLND